MKLKRGAAVVAVVVMIAMSCQIYILARQNSFHQVWAVLDQMDLPQEERQSSNKSSGELIHQDRSNLSDQAENRSQMEGMEGSFSGNSFNDGLVLPDAASLLSDDVVSNRTRVQDTVTVSSLFRQEKMENSTTSTEIGGPSAKPLHQEPATTKDPALEYASWSPLRDKTLWYNPNVTRMWLVEDGYKPKPPAMLLITSFGYNQPNTSAGLDIFRGLHGRDLFLGIINHPWFHPTAWDDIEAGRMPVSSSTRYYVFVDRDTCGERNYPYYGKGRLSNADRLHQRGTCCGTKTLFVDEVMNSTLFRQSSLAKLIVFECGGFGPKKKFKAARKALGKQLVFASLSAHKSQLLPDHDVGLPPPGCNVCHLTAEERAAISNCNDTGRPYLISFSGNMRSSARRDLFLLNNGKDILIGSSKHDVLGWMNTSSPQHAFREMAKRSKFGAAPLGDNLFSYRFTEVMSCGAIPVVYADGWLTPFGPDLVDWKEAAVFIPEDKANHTDMILSRISVEKRCLMRKRALELFETYLRSGKDVLRGIIESLEGAATRTPSYTGQIKQESNEESSCNTTVESPLNDKSLCWRPSVDRMWTDENFVATKPPAKVILTQFGWNGDETWKPRRPRPSWRRHNRSHYFRTLWSRELMQGLVDHQWFDPTSWTNKIEKPVFSNNTRHYLFLDLETCEENNYPFFGRGLDGNLDTHRGRTNRVEENDIAGVLKSMWQNIPHAVEWKVVLFHCRHAPLDKRLERAKGDPHLSIASVSSSYSDLVPGLDQIIPSPGYRTHKLTQQQRNDIESCRERDFLLFFAGHLRTALRRDLRRLHDGRKIMIGSVEEMQSWRNTSDPYLSMTVLSSFAAVPLETGKEAARLTEVMSAGAIPVVLAVDEVPLPFSNLIDWTEVAIFVPEYDAIKTADILSSISPARQCAMRKRVVEVYDKYCSSAKAIAHGVIEGLEKMATTLL